MANNSNSGDCGKSFDPQPILYEQIERHQAGDDSATDVYGNDRAGPVDHDRRNILHAKELKFLSRNDLPCGQLSNRDVNIAPDKRTKEQK